MPKVSVLMPVYKTNREYLKDSIKSILKQTYSDFEFLIIDDCPEDSREDVLKSFSDQRIVYLKNDNNLGISKTRNKLIDLAKGEYLAIFDHDDISLPLRLEKQVEFLDKNPDVGVLGCKVQYFQNSNQLIENPENDHEIRLALMSYCAIIHPGSMVRKSLLSEHNIAYEEKFSPAEDYALWCRLMPYTKFYNMPEILLNYRVHGKNTSKKQQDRLKHAAMAIHAFVKVLYPALYEEFNQRVERVFKYRLFGVLDIFKIVKHYDCISVYLFGKILIMKIKISEIIK